jgi:hypothetical protein
MLFVLKSNGAVSGKSSVVLSVREQESLESHYSGGRFSSPYTRDFLSYRSVYCFVFVDSVSLSLST